MKSRNSGNLKKDSKMPWQEAILKHARAQRRKGGYSKQIRTTPYAMSGCEDEESEELK